MTVKLSCRCGQHIEVNQSAAGQRFRCPSCDILLAVPHVPIVSKVLKSNESVTGIQLTKKNLKRAIMISVALFITGIAMGIMGLGIHEKPVLIIGSILALLGFGWLLTIRSQIRRNQSIR